jgi:hypothetical protein
MPRKPHPADLANAAVIANAVRFDLALFLGVGRYARASAGNLADARHEAKRLAALHPNGRRALIYAIDANSRSALVTDDIPTEARETAMKTYAKKFNAQRAAKAAGHELDQIEIVKTKDGFTYRVKDGAAAVHVNDLAASDHPVAKANADSWNAIPAVKRAGRTATKPKAGSAAATRPLGKRAEIEAAAREGKLPEPPDFSAETHKRFRNKLASVIERAKAGDLKGLRAFEINPVSSSPKAIARYRDLCIIALEARRQAA